MFRWGDTCETSKSCIALWNLVRKCTFKAKKNCSLSSSPKMGETSTESKVCHFCKSTIFDSEDFFAHVRTYHHNSAVASGWIPCSVCALLYPGKVPLKLRAFLRNLRAIRSCHKWRLKMSKCAEAKNVVLCF